MNITIISVVIAALLSGFGTWKLQENRYAAKELAHLEAQRELTRLQNAAAHAASEAHEETKTVIATKFITIKETVDNVITKIEYRDRVCYDADGLRAHARAIRVTGAASEPTYTVPTLAIP